ncbi:DUF6602 domain-containing protein [Streptomyces sp. TBY4]|uniref:DUF6602 domain-containing protein n=1 Tax=Streptomyces sp. TBY4 TaxID=2962030 RepID=UPI0020B68B9A|nr:DUF6602 domain-containing protein [Streptomyces sp. TBY4]MCP3755771.1 hypothetical protein [Streptomyces sp. TBY4]
MASDYQPEGRAAVGPAGDVVTAASANDGCRDCVAHAALHRLRQVLSNVVALQEEFASSATHHHPDDIGYDREFALREALAQHFPEAVLLHRPSIADEESDKGYGMPDIAFASREVQPHRVLRNGRLYIDPRAVHCTVEVKSTLDGKELKSALAEVSRAQGAFRRRVGEDHFEFREAGSPLPYFPTQGGVFAFRSKLKLSTIAERVTEWTRGRPPELWPRFVTVLDRGHIMWCDRETGGARPWPAADSVLMMWEHRPPETDPTDPLVAMITQLDWMAQAWHVPGTWPGLRPLRLPHGLRVGIPVRPDGVPAPPDAKCEHLCANCHEFGRMTFDAQLRQDEAPTV